MQKLTTQYGAGTIMRMGDRTAEVVEVISTGALTLDVALGVGGIPRGRVTEIYGPESAGKTTLALHLIAECQRSGGVACMVDAEHALDTQYAARLGVNVDDLLISQPDNGEQALEVVDTLVRSGGVDIIIVDSVAALVPKAEIDGEMGDSHVGLHARLMSQALRKLTPAIQNSRCAVVFINQLRMKIGVMFGNPEVTTGGMALKYYASVRLDIRKIDTLKEGVDAVGGRIRVKVQKNKVAAPFRQGEFDILYNHGISWEGSVLDQAVICGVVEKSGAWFSFGDLRLGNGRPRVVEALTADRELTAEITAAVWAALKAVRVAEDGEDMEDRVVPPSPESRAAALNLLDGEAADDRSPEELAASRR
jgi:recombination protein RecA